MWLRASSTTFKSRFLLVFQWKTVLSSQYPKVCHPHRRYTSLWLFTSLRACVCIEIRTTKVKKRGNGRKSNTASRQIQKASFQFLGPFFIETLSNTKLRFILTIFYTLGERLTTWSLAVTTNLWNRKRENNGDMRNQVEIKCFKLWFEDGCGQTGQQTRNDVKLQKKTNCFEKN